jgi:hypothetical protein
MILPTGDRLCHPMRECWLRTSGEVTRWLESGSPIVTLADGTVQVLR